MVPLPDDLPDDGFQKLRNGDRDLLCRSYTRSATNRQCGEREIYNPQESALWDSGQLNDYPHLEARGNHTEMQRLSGRGKQGHLGELPWSNISGDGLEMTNSEAHVVGFAVGYGGRQYHNKFNTDARKNLGWVGWRPSEFLPPHCNTEKGWDSQEKRQGARKCEQESDITLEPDLVDRAESELTLGTGAIKLTSKGSDCWFTLPPRGANSGVGPPPDAERSQNASSSSAPAFQPGGATGPFPLQSKSGQTSSGAKDQRTSPDASNAERMTEPSAPAATPGAADQIISSPSNKLQRIGCPHAVTKHRRVYSDC